MKNIREAGPESGPGKRTYFLDFLIQILIRQANFQAQIPGSIVGHSSVEKNKP
jgi:hypothetical protein